MSLRESILAANDCEKEPIDIPEWGSPPLFVKVWDGTTRDAYDVWGRARKDKNGFNGVRAHVARISLVDESGADVFTDADEPELQKKNGAVLNRIFDAAFRLNLVGDAALEDAKKNSKSGQSGDSGSSSPSKSAAAQ